MYYIEIIGNDIGQGFPASIMSYCEELEAFNWEIDLTDILKEMQDTYSQVPVFNKVIITKV